MKLVCNFVAYKRLCQNKAAMLQEMEQRAAVITA